ncbi:hypothetical protein ACS0TY_019536 [Phlomoides rotata]
MDCVQRWKPVGGMVVVEFSLAIVNVLFKKALNAGMDHVIIVLYRQSIATVFLIPLVYFWERGSWNKLTARLIGQMFLCALLGLTLSQYLFLVGLDYTSATFTCAFINLVPVVTFVLALALRMEKVNLKRKSGKGKVIGTLTCVVGATTLSFYKGMRLIKAGHDVLKQQQGRAKGLGTGSAFLFAGSIAWSSWFLIQSKIGHNFPYTYSSTSIMSLFSAVQSALLFLITDRNMSKWIVKGYLHILSVVYAHFRIHCGNCWNVYSSVGQKQG